MIEWHTADLGAPSDWIECMVPATKSLIQEMEAAGLSFEEIADAWVNGSGAQNTFPFGAQPDKKGFYEALKNECRRVICGDEEYDDLRARAVTMFASQKSPALTMMGGVIGAKFGLAPALVVPYLALLIASAAQVGVAAWCGSHPVNEA